MFSGKTAHDSIPIINLSPVAASAAELWNRESPKNLVWHWNGKRRLILEFRFRWRMHTNLINQTKHRQPYLFKFTWEKKKQTKHSNTTQTNIAVYICPPALNTFVTLLALSGSSVHASVCPWVPHSARCARLARRSRDDQKTLSIHFPERPFCLNF